jgi:PAS domain S-box-containing protein
LPAAAADASAFALGDVKALHARMSDGHMDYEVIVDDPAGVDPQALLDALDGRSEEMAKRAFDIFQTVFPETGTWSAKETAHFIDQSRRRFEAILAVTAHGEDVDLASELQDVGAAAAWSGSSLPQLLVVLRISRDLVVQTAVEVAEERGRHWGLALSLLLTRVLPAMDRLTDAVAQGYWEAIIGREAESSARYESVIEHTSDGVYELDLDGRILYANSALALVLGRRPSDLHGARITDVLTTVDGSSIDALLGGGTRQSDLTIERPDGVRREIAVTTYPRVHDDETIGFQGIVRDISAETEVEQQKNEFLALITSDLRQPLTIVLGLGVTLEGYARELPHDRIERMGTSIRQQAERMARLADDLYAASRIETQALMVNLRPIALRPTIEAALGTIEEAANVDVDVDDDIVVQADPRRLEQVVANLVENAIAYGARPVVVCAHTCGDDLIELTVDDDGSGVDAELRPTLFTRARTRGDRDGTRGGGLGLVLVRGLVEAMGGRVWYTERVGGGASFHLTLSTPRVFADHQEQP